MDIQVGKEHCLNILSADVAAGFHVRLRNSLYVSDGFEPLYGSSAKKFKTVLEETNPFSECSINLQA